MSGFVSQVSPDFEVRCESVTDFSVSQDVTPLRFFSHEEIFKS